MSQARIRSPSSVLSTRPAKHDVKERQYRSFDQYLDDAYNQESTTKWQYWSAMLSLSLANSSDSAEILCLAFLLSDSSFGNEILGHSTWKASLLAASVFLGMFVGCLVVGTFGDRIGRRPMVLIGLGSSVAAGTLSSFAQNVYQISFLRAIAGVGIGSTSPPLLTLVSELSPPSRRGLFVTMASGFWMFGNIFVAIVAWLLLGYFPHYWRWFLAACSMPAASSFVLIHFLVTESPRFLAFHQKQSKSLESVNYLAKQMCHSGPPMTLEEVVHFYPVSDKTLLHFSFCQHVRDGFCEFFRSTARLYSQGQWPTTVPIQVVWAAFCFGSDGISTWINRIFLTVHLPNIYFNAFLFALALLPGNILSALLMDATTRQNMLSAGFVAAAMSLISFAFFAWDRSTLHKVGIVASACAFHTCAQVAWNSISTSTTERFPTIIRSSGWALCSSTGKLSGALAQIINAALVSRPVWLLLVASCSMVVAAVAPFFLPGEDMRNRSLEDHVASPETKQNKTDLAEEGSHSSIHAPQTLYGAV